MVIMAQERGKLKRRARELASGATLSALERQCCARSPVW